MNNDIKKQFETENEAALYDEVTNLSGGEAVSADSLAALASDYLNSGNKKGSRIFRVIGKLDRSAFYDEYYYLTARYEACKSGLSVNERIERLKDICSFSPSVHYAVELACYYLETGKPNKAKRTITQMEPFEGITDEMQLILDDIENATSHYKALIGSANADEVPKEKERASAVTEPQKDIRFTEADKDKQANGRVSLADLYEDNEADDDNYPDFIRDSFAGLVGMNTVKKEIAGIYNKISIKKLRRERLGLKDNNQIRMAFCIYGNPGTGKTTVARMIGKMFYNMGLLETDEVIETDRSGIVASYIGQTEENMRSLLEKSRGATLFIDEAYELYREDSDNDFGKEAIDVLLKDVEDHGGEYCIIIAGYKDEMVNMLKKANPGFISRFQYKIEIPNYSESELIRILCKNAEKEQYKIDADAESTVLDRIRRENIDKTFDNARFMRRLFDEATSNQANRLTASNLIQEEDLVWLLKEDFQTAEAENVKTLEEYLDELDNLIGLVNVKKEVREIVALQQFKKKSEEEGKTISNLMGTLHMIFTGSPGTGKTTVARLIAQIYGKLGILKRPDVYVECKRKDLVAGYTGQTAIKTKEVFDSALGGVLFIDEAYDLVNSDNDSFGLEAVNTLLAEIENHRSDILVVLAGYDKEMKEFLKTNPGLTSRLSRIIHFDDYDLNELTQIMKYDLKKRNMILSAVDDADFERLIDRYRHAEDFGNARGVRNLCDRVIRRYVQRANAGEENNLIIIKSDLEV